MGERTCSIEEDGTSCTAPVYGRDWCIKHYTRWRRNGDPLLSKRPTYRLSEDVQFFTKVDAEGDCWEWLAARTKDGYGSFHSTLAHLWIWRHLVGPIPAGHEVDHQCRNRGCVNPDHLDVVTAEVNKQRSFSPAALHARKTHCPAGHPYAGENLGITTRANGRVKRYCRACLKQKRATKVIA